jgi:tetratricopeptide (TPR) repeat protein
VKRALAFCFALLLFAAATSISIAQSTQQPKTPVAKAQTGQVPPTSAPAPTRAAVLALADQYIASLTPTLSPEEKAAVDKVTFTLESQRTVPTFENQYVDELVNQCTIALANTNGLEAVIVTSADLLKMVPANARAANLFGVTLHTIGKNNDAITVLEYTRTLSPESELVMLNAANVYLDLDQDAKAKALIDKVIAQDPKNKSAYSALVTYWFKKGDLRQAVDAMIKGAALGGWAAKRAAEKNGEATEQNAVSDADTTAQMEQKLDALKDLVPNTTADFIEDQFPDQAKQIRDRYCRLVDSEKMIMPPLPQVNTSGVKNWKTKGAPYIKQWQKAFETNAKEAGYEMAHLTAGINRGDSKEAIKQKAAAAKNQEIQKAVGNQEQMIKMLENMPGISEAQRAQMLKKMQEATAKMGIQPATGPAPSAEPETITSDADAEKIGANDVPPGYDYGSPFAITNYRDYQAIENGYGMYFNKYYNKDFVPNVTDIFAVYRRKLQEEKDLHAANLKQIDDAQQRAREADTETFELERRKEDLRYKKAVNLLGDDYFAQWANVALPQYTKKMKPMLDQYWAVCALYIRNMNQPEVMKLEYIKTKNTFWMFAGIAVGLMMPDRDFVYLGETDEEERQLQADIAAAEEGAKGKLEGYKNETHLADAALLKWLDDHFAVGISGEFLSLKLTPRTLTIDEYILGLNFKHVLDFKTGTWTTYRSFAAKLDIGIQVGPVKVGVSARADFLQTYDTVNLRDGKVTEGGGRFLDVSAGASVRAANITAGQGVLVTLDPAAESEWSVKAGTPSLSGKVGNLTIKY